jgi:Mrp family chromosome partitioning ATPase
MARILDALHRSENRGSREINEPKPIRNETPINPDVDEESDIPFIEVGGPSPKMQLKTGRGNPAPIPTIIPLPRPAVEEPRSEKESLPLFHISFQPLPFPRRHERSSERRFSPELVSYHQPAHAVSEQYRHLLSRIESQFDADARKALLFTSAMAGAGTTSVLLNLAVTTARREGARVVVVDANLARPAIAARVDAAAAPGLGEILARTVPLAWGIQETALSNLHVVTAGQAPGEPVMDLWPLVLDQLQNRFDWVLIDAAEWARPELSALSATASATYLVIRQSDLEAPELNDLLVKIPHAGAHLRGYVLVSKD